MRLFFERDKTILRTLKKIQIISQTSKPVLFIRAKVNANTGAVITSYLLFGVVGAIIASDADSVFEMKIDHSNGSFIRIKEVE